MFFNLYIQGDQLYMAVCFWYLVKSDMSSVQYWTVAYSWQVKVPESYLSGRVVWTYKKKTYILFENIYPW